MAPAMLHVFSDLSALASDTDIKEAILTNYSDIPSTTEAATQLQNIQFSINKPLVTFNHRYEAIHKVAFRMLPSEQESKTLIVEYAKKLPTNTRDKLLRKIAKNNSYIKTLDDAFKQAIDINRETSFVEAATGRYNNQNGTKIETQINELGDSFQEYDVNVMNTRSTNRSGDRSWNRSFERSKIIHSIHHKILDQITEAAITQVTMTGTTDRTTTETMAETEVTSNNRGTNREIRTSQTGMTITKIETGWTTEENQTNTNTTGSNTKLKSSLNSQTKT